MLAWLRAVAAERAGNLQVIRKDYDASGHAVKIAFVASGHLPVPPEGWGAVEQIIWSFHQQLAARGHEVKLFNSVWYNDVIVELNSQRYDFIHVHSDLYCGAFNRHLRRPYCLTSHYGGFGRYMPNTTDPSYDILFLDTLAAPGNIVFSNHVAQIYHRQGYRGFLRVLPNPVDVGRFVARAAGNGRALCLARIQPRKRQVELAALVDGWAPLDFVGPSADPAQTAVLNGRTTRYLGSWSRAEVYARLSEYSCLVLLSHAEGDPLVVKEALAAGLGVVVSSSSVADLPSEPFVTVVPDDERDPRVIANAITSAIAANRSLRARARAYAFDRFDAGVVTTEYLRIIADFRSTHES